MLVKELSRDFKCFELNENEHRALQEQWGRCSGAPPSAPQQWRLKSLGPCCPQGRPGQSPQLLAAGRPPTAAAGTGRMNGNSVSLCLSDFQINTNKQNLNYIYSKFIYIYSSFIFNYLLFKIFGIQQSDSYRETALNEHIRKKKPQRKSNNWSPKQAGNETIKTK